MARRGQETTRTTMKLTPMALKLLESLGEILGVDDQDVMELALRELADKWLTKPWLVYAQDGSVEIGNDKAS